MWDNDPVWRMNMIQYGHTRDTLPQLDRLIDQAQEMKDENKATGSMSKSERGAWHKDRQEQIDQGKSGHWGTRGFDNKGNPTKGKKGKHDPYTSGEGKSKGKAGTGAPDAPWTEDDE